MLRLFTRQICTPGRGVLVGPTPPGIEPKSAATHKTSTPGAVSDVARGMMSTYSGGWFVYVAGGLPLASYAPNSKLLSCWPSPWASTDRKVPTFGAVIAGGSAAIAVVVDAARANTHIAAMRLLMPRHSTTPSAH